MAERFAHFKGVQVNLTDQNGQPLTLTATPGTATSVSATSLTIAANDGSTRTFNIDDQTIMPGAHTQNDGAATQPRIAQGDNVVVVSINGSSTATALLSGGPDGFGPHGASGHWPA